MRLDVRSTGSGKNTTPSANRVFVQQAAAEHKNRFGSPLSVEMPASTAKIVKETRGKHRGVGGNPRFEFMNQKLKIAKRMAGRGKVLSPDEVSAVRDQAAAEWAELTDDLRHEWDLVHRASALERRMRRAGADDGQGAIANDAEPESNNLWGTRGGSHCLVPAEVVMNEYESSSSSTRRELAIHNPDLVIAATGIQNRVLDVHDVNDDPDEITESGAQPRVKICSCWEAKKNVCVANLDETVRNRMAAIRETLKDFCNTLPKDCNECEHMLLLRGSNRDEDSDRDAIDVIVWLVLRRLLPKVQYVARVALRESGSLAFVSPAFPFLVEITTRTSRTDARQQAVHLCTSDELALDLARLKNKWVLRPVHWEEVHAEGSLLVARVVGLGEAFVPKRHAKQRRTTQSMSDILDEIAGDPSEFAGPRGRGATSSAPVTEHAEEAVDVEDVLEDGMGMVDELMDGMPPEFREDVLDEIEEALGAIVAEELAADDLLDASSKGAPMPTDDCLESREGPVLESDDDAVRVEKWAADLSSSTGPSTSGASSSCGGSKSGGIPLSIDEVLLASVVMDDSGYVTCSLPPWNAWATLGRLTTWPADVPMEKRNVSLKCHMHPKCSTPVRRRKNVTDKEMICWLLHGTCDELLPTASRADELAKEHKAAWARVIDGMRGVAASTSAAASSAVAIPLAD